MRKTCRLFFIFFAFILVVVCLFYIQSRQVQFGVDEHGLNVSFNCNGEKKIIYPWYGNESDIFYFFLPSFVKKNTVYCDEIRSGEIVVGDHALARHQSFQWEPDEVYTITLADGQICKVCFMKSANLPAVFIETDSGSMEYLNADKENGERGKIAVVNTQGNMEYAGKLERISGRGNYSWIMDKRPYTFKLCESRALCGMDSGKKWNLLAMRLEGAKLNNMICFQIARELGLEYTSQAQWVDCYFNGEYGGLYLLTEAVTVGEGRVEIGDSLGNYLVEKELPERYAYEREHGNAGFVTDAGNCFVIHSPKDLSEDETEDVREYFQMIEDKIVFESPDYADYIDVDSFAKRFLVDEIAYNIDFGNTSTFFYKKENDSKLYGGPVWDYDVAFGGDINVAYDQSLLDSDAESMLNWYHYLCRDEQFYLSLVKEYEGLLPFLTYMLNEGIDQYADLIRDSVMMDSMRWSNTWRYGDRAGYYQEYENNVRYTRYFLAKRLNYFNERFGIEYDAFVTPENGKTHIVQFWENNSLVEMQYVMDGRAAKPPLQTDSDSQDWVYSYSGEKYCTYLPVYEDVMLIAEENSEYETSSFGNECRLSDYLGMLHNDTYSCCIYIPKGSAVYQNETILNQIRVLLGDEETRFDVAKMRRDDFFVVIDNAWERKYECVGNEMLEQYSTTFGLVDYNIENQYLYINGTALNYLCLPVEETDIQIIVIYKYLGNIEDVAAFRMDGADGYRCRQRIE